MAQNSNETNDCQSVLSDSTYCKYYAHNWITQFEDSFNIEKAVVTFNHNHLKEMYDKYHSTTHVRIYFTLLSDSGMQLPGLILVPYLKDNCHVDVTDTVLEAKRLNIGGYYGRFQSKTTTQMTNWKTIADGMSDDLKPIYGYNFTWSQIMDACRWGQDRLGVAFGISDVDPDGSNKREIHMYLTDGVEHLENRLFVDFSSPCPRLCGQLSSDE